MALTIGYLFGIFQTGYIYGKTQGIDIREHGSGNAGATNTLRTLGAKAGAITLLGDCFKPILAILLVKFLLGDMFTGDIKVLELYAGFGAVLGHNYPFYLKFKGGKGVACTAGVVIAIAPLAVPLCLVVFIICVKLTRYVSLGSILMAILFILQIVLFNYYGFLGINEASVLEFNLLSLAFSVMVIYRHKANIVRLMNGTENKISLKKK